MDGYNVVLDGVVCRTSGSVGGGGAEVFGNTGKMGKNVHDQKDVFQ